MTTPTIAHPPETVEGWYALHQVFRSTKGKSDSTRLTRLAADATETISTARTSGRSKKKVTSGGGWSCFVGIIGSTSDLMAIHFRETLDGIGDAERALAKSELGRGVDLVYSFLSVTEAGLYHITAELARAADARGGKVGDAEYARTLAGRIAAERDSDHLRRRLYPELPRDMPYACFYPMSKRREAPPNWYTLTLD